MVWEWTVPKVSRPVTANNDHWQAAGAGTTNEAPYTPVDTVDTETASDVGKVLRVKVTYEDAQGADKELIMLSYDTVRAAPDCERRPPTSIRLPRQASMLMRTRRLVRLWARSGVQMSILPIP